MPRKTWPSRAYPRPQIIRSGPWKGMRDAQEPESADPQYAKLIQNAYASNVDIGLRCITGIPGFALAGTQLGSVGARTCQWIGQFARTNGTTQSLVIVNGALSEYNWGANTYTTRLTNAQITGAGATLSTTATVYCVVYNDLLIVSDGVNKPFQWDGTSGGGVTLLSNAPICYGQPVIYSEKLMMIKAAERDTFVWSEEGQPNVGYEAGGYLNVWGIGGAKAERLVALAPRNETLGVIRERSTTEIAGQVATDFKTTATRASVSEKIGTTAPGAVLVLDEGTLSVDAFGRPQFWPKGGTYTVAPALWDACAQTVSGIATSQIPNIQITDDEACSLFWVSFAALGASSLTSHLLFERTGGVPNLVGVAQFVAQRMGTWINASGQRVLVHSGVDDGYLYYHGTPTGSLWNFGYNAGTTPIPHEVRPAEMGVDIGEEKNWDEFSISIITDTAATFSFDYVTPSATSAATQTIAFTGGGSLWDSFLWDTGTWGGASGNTRKRVGINMHGRWMIPSIRHAVLNEQLCLIMCEAVAFSEGRDPEIA